MKIYNSPIITQEFLEKYKSKQPKWGFNGLGMVVYRRTYSRLKSDETYEEWYETVARCINGAQEIGADYTKVEAEKLYDYIFNLKCSFAGRMLWMLGTEHIKRWGGNALLNCWFTTIQEYEDFCFIFENLMLGGGVGFSIRREDIHELPKVKENIKVTHKNTADADFIVPDSREGWVYLLRQVLKSFFRSGKSFSYSTILVRGYGEKIHGLGGTASGPKILVDGIENICKVLQSREGKKLRSIEVLDICNIIGSIVVSGNIRRSAQIALGDPDDYLFIRAKRWDLGDIPNWRALSNNTIYADDFTHIQPDIWEGYSGNGECYGFFNIKLAQKVGRIRELRKDNCEGSNPCITGDTLIAVADGRNAISIKQLVEENKDVPVYCQDKDSALIGKHKVVVKMGRNFRLTEKKADVYKVILDDGSSVKATKNHKFMLRDGSYKELGSLQIGDSLMPFNTQLQNGYITINSNAKYWKRQFRLLWEFINNKKQPKGFHIHHKDRNKLNDNIENLELISAEEHKKIHDISGDKNPMRRFPEKNIFNNKEWQKEIRLKYHIGKKRSEKTCKNISKAKISQHVISIFKNKTFEEIYGEEKAKEFKNKLSISRLGKTPWNKGLSKIKSKYYNHKITKIEYEGKEDVYNLTVDDNHNYMIVTKYNDDKTSSGICIKNCAEIVLANKECCCLSELYLNNIESKHELIECAKLLYKTQKAINNLKFIHEDTNKIVKKNMRIGIGITGVCQSLNKVEWLDDCYKSIREFDKEWSAKKGYNESIRISTIKPSGTLSLLAGATPGIHPAYSKYYIRRIRMSSDDKLVALCKEMGYHVENVKNFDETIDHNTVIVEFPCYAGENVVEAKDMTAIKQLELVKQLMTLWADNSISVTVYYKKEELPEIKKWLKEHYKDSIKSVSFLLHKEHGFKQAPYEEITKEQYEERMDKVKSLKDIVVENKHIDFEECSKGSCPIK